MKRQKGQLLIVIAIVISIAMLFLAVAVDAGRLYLERNRMRRGAQSAADAGVGLAAEEMVEIAEFRREDAIKKWQEEVEEAQMEWEDACLGGVNFPDDPAPDPDPEINCDEEFEPEPFEPCDPEPQCWLLPEDWVTMQGGTISNAVEREALNYARLNGFDLNDPITLALNVTYEVDAGKLELLVNVQIRRQASILLVGLLGQSFAVLDVEGESVVRP
jgi:hypothetical protein